MWQLFPPVIIYPALLLIMLKEGSLCRLTRYNSKMFSWQMTGYKSGYIACSETLFPNKRVTNNNARWFIGFRLFPESILICSRGSFSVVLEITDAVNYKSQIPHPVSDTKETVCQLFPPTNHVKRRLLLEQCIKTLGDKSIKFGEDSCLGLAKSTGRE